MVRVIGALFGALLVAGCACAQSAPTGTNYPGSLDNNSNMGAVAPGDTITSAGANTQSSAIRALESAIGTSSSLSTTSILQRLDTKANITDLAVSLSTKLINYTLNAGAYTGSDIGAQVNAAVGDCDTQVGASGYCRITIPPTVYTQTTPIKIGRSNTELDCQGAILYAHSSFTDDPIRINFPTAGSQISYWIDNVAVRNCTLKNAPQTSVSALEGVDSRVDRIVVWRVSNVHLAHLTIDTPWGPGLGVYESQGVIEDVEVDHTRVPYTNGSAAGLYLVGKGYGSAAQGNPIYARNIRVSDSATVGVWAVVGAELRDVDVTGADGACVLLGGAATQGWITLDGYTLTDCNGTSASPTGAVSDAAAAGNPLAYVTIRNGFLRRLASDGIRLASATALLGGTVIEGNTIECFGGGAFSATRGIAVHPGGIPFTSESYTTIRNNTIRNSGGCSGGGTTQAGIEVLTGGASVEVSGNILTDIGTLGTNGYGVMVSGELYHAVIADNTARDILTAPIYLTGSPLVDVVVRGNSLGCTSTDCGLIVLSATSPTYQDLLLTGNRSTGSTLYTSMYGIKTSIGGSPTVVNVVANDNYFADLNGTTSGRELSQASGTLPITFGQSQFGASMGDRTNRWVKLLNLSGSTVTAGHAVCSSAAGNMAECATGTTARLAVGIAAYTTTNNTAGDVITHGLVSGVPCTGSVSVGDLLVRSTTANGSVEANNTPGPGEAIGKAQSSCSTTLTLIVGTGQ